jgi:hypothetical protein
VDKVAEVQLVHARDRFVHNVGAIRGVVDPSLLDRILIRYDRLLRRGSVRQGIVTGASSNGVTLTDGEHIEGDIVVVATGSHYASPFKPQGESTQAFADSLRTAHSNLMSAKAVAIVGGGAVGTELAGEISSLYPRKVVTLVSGFAVPRTGLRRIFPFLSKGTTPHAPVVLALDAAQEPFGFSSAGLAAVGITDVEDEELPSNHRSTQEIVDLAFYVIQQTTDLFGPDFPDFKKVEVGLSASQKALAAPPVIIECNEDAKSFGRFIVKTVQKLRAKNVRQIAVVCHGETYWEELRRDFSASQLPLHILAQRGERLAPDQPLVVLSRPNFVGGQEFDAVVLVGLEQGLVPPRVLDNAALAAAIEQQVLREMYLSITRARTRLIVAINQGAMPNSIIEAAKSQLLILNGTIN